MNIIEIISKKRDKKELTKEEIEYFIKNYTTEKIPDYQASALIMAMYINGLTDQEIFYMTYAMANSGEMLDLSDIGENVIDKHSTGGVGDKVSIVLLPIVAALGVPVAKMSGRGLGFTGGTADKLEAIPGYNTSATIKEFKENVKKIGISMITQTMNIAPADKKIYSIRDTIGCVESLPLIASSIMSKKIALGAKKLVLEVTYGEGAFMKKLENARKLADEMVKLGKSAGLEVKCVFTKMDEPLGWAVGNTLEIIESINFLKGDMPKDLRNVVLEIGSIMLQLAGKGDNLDENKIIMQKCIDSGKAFEKFEEMVKNQGGDITYLKDTSKFPKAKYSKEILSKESGKIVDLNAEKIGKLACTLGAGRVKKEDKIDMEAGIVLNKKVGQDVEKNEKIATIYSNSEEKINEVLEKIYYAIDIEKK